MLRWRLLLGAVLIASLVGLVWLDHAVATPGAVLFGVALVLTVLAAQEVVSLLAAGGYRPLAGVIIGTKISLQSLSL